jgi:hypothetical protein
VLSILAFKADRITGVSHQHPALLLFVSGKVLLCSPGWPQTQTFVSASQVLGLYMCTTLPSMFFLFFLTLLGFYHLFGAYNQSTTTYLLVG